MTTTATVRFQGVLAVAASLIAVTLAVAAIVRIGWAGDVRRTLAFPFAGLTPRIDTAAAIFATNARLLAAVFAAVLVAQSPWLAGHTATRGPLDLAVLAAVDAVLVLAVAANTVLVGAALGAYGTPMVAAVLPHGPLELGAFATALALHLRARHGRLATRQIITTAAVCLALLALAAALETYVVL